MQLMRLRDSTVVVELRVPCPVGWRRLPVAQVALLSASPEWHRGPLDRVSGTRYHCGHEMSAGDGNGSRIGCLDSQARDLARNAERFEPDGFRRVSQQCHDRMAFALSLTWPPITVEELAAAACVEGVDAAAALRDALRAGRTLVAPLRGLRVAVSAFPADCSPPTCSDADGSTPVVLRLPTRAGGAVSVALRPQAHGAMAAGADVAMKLIEVTIVQTPELLVDASTPAKPRSASLASTICSAASSSCASSGGSSRDSTPPKGTDGTLDILEQSSITAASTVSSSTRSSSVVGVPATVTVAVAFAAGERVEAVLLRALASAALLHGQQPTVALRSATSVFPHAEVAAWEPVAAAAAAAPAAGGDSDDLAGIAAPALLSMSDPVPWTAARLQFTARPPPRAASPLWSSRRPVDAFGTIDVTAQNDSAHFEPVEAVSDLHPATAGRGEGTSASHGLHRDWASATAGSRFTATAAAAASIFIPASMAPHERMVAELRAHLSAVVDAWRAAGHACVLSTGYTDVDASMDLVHKKLPSAADPALKALETCTHEMNMRTNGSKGGRGVELRELEAWRRDLVHAGAIPALIDIVRVIPDSDASRKVLEHTVQTITNVAFDNDSRSRVIHAPLQLVQVLVNRMGADSDTAEMQLKTARCLTTLCFENSEAVSQVIRAGGVERALAAIATHHSHTFTVCKCMELLDVIREGEGFAQRLRAVVGAAVVLQRECTRADRGHRHVQHACRVVSMLPELTAEAALAGGCSSSSGATGGAGAFHFDARTPAASAGARYGRDGDGAAAWRGHGGSSRGGRGSHRSSGYTSMGKRGDGLGSGKW